jgi:hypothetical protein
MSILIIGCDSEQKENSLTEQNIKGDVKSISATTYKAIERFGEIEKDSIALSFGFDYNEEGNQVGQIYYNSDGSLGGKSTYEYDEEGNQVESTAYNSDGNISWKSTYEYDEEGNQVESIFSWPEEVIYYKHTYEYDEEGNKVASTAYNSDGSVDGKSTYVYDEYDNKGNWTRYIEFEDGVANGIKEREFEYYD